MMSRRVLAQDALCRDLNVLAIAASIQVKCAEDMITDKRYKWTDRELDHLKSAVDIMGRRLSSAEAHAVHRAHGQSQEYLGRPACLNQCEQRFRRDRREQTARELLARNRAVGDRRSVGPFPGGSDRCRIVVADGYASTD